jgi:hypothetical protein
MSKPHSIRYIKQLMEWGFDKEFIAKDCGINLASLDDEIKKSRGKGAQWESRN